MLAQTLTAAAALMLAAGSSAQALNDPTRPPFEILTAVPVTAGAAPPTPLSSILLSSARKGAIISGEYVALGGRVGDAKLVKITPTEVTLSSARGMEVLQLYPPLANATAASGADGKPEKTVKRP